MSTVKVYQGVLEMDGDLHRLIHKVYVHEYGQDPKPLAPVWEMYAEGDPRDEKDPFEWGVPGTKAGHLAAALLTDAFSLGIAFGFRSLFMTAFVRELEADKPWELTHDRLVEIARNLDGWVIETAG